MARDEGVNQGAGHGAAALQIDPVPGPDPFPAVFKGPAGRRVDFRRKIVAQEEDVHG